MRKTQLSAGFALLTLALSACGGSLESTQMPQNAPSSPAVSVASESAPASASASASSSASVSSSPSQTPVVTSDETSASATSSPSSHELANAVKIPLQESQAGPEYEGYASLRTPTGNIGCSIAADGKTGYCGVHSWASDRKYPAGEMSGHTFYGWVLRLTGENTMTPAPKTDAPDYMVRSITAEYGTTYTYGDFACDSQENGLTCWSTVTGKGYFMNRDGYQPITR